MLELSKGYVDAVWHKKDQHKNREEVVLKVEELEAMRLKDIEELNQEECAKKMEESTQTF